MQHDLANIEWAWSAYEPSEDALWSRRLAAHLHRRVGFGATWEQLDETIKVGPAETLKRLFQPEASAADKQFEQTVADLGERAAVRGGPQQIQAWWLYRMLGTSDPLLEKLTLFWHGHFATGASKVNSSRLMLDQNELLRRSAKGKFEEMVKSISRDPAMLIYLDSTSNRRIHPNENYARELMELFCLGVGNYTEHDIKELARAFTGWEIHGSDFYFDRSQHDTGIKKVLGRAGNFDGDEGVRIVLDQPAAPRFIARKLIRFFVFDEPNVSDALVEPIARELRERDFEIGPVVRRLLSSNLFFSEHAVGKKVRSPVELGVGLLRSLGATTNLVRLAQGLFEIGQGLFQPPNVKGWDGGRSWIDSSALLGRANLVRQMMTASETSYGKSGTLAGVADRAGVKSPVQVVDWLLELLVAVPVATDARSALVALASDSGADRSRSIAAVIHAISALPEFQLS